MMHIVASDEKVGIGVHQVQVETLADEGDEEREEDEEKSTQRRIQTGH
jgi:hypothetical protein